METQKPLETPVEPGAQPGDADEVQAKRRKPGKFDQLAIDDLDAGGDPYNSTGSHVILELKKYAGE